MLLYIREAVKQYCATVNLKIPYNSSHLYSVKARIVRLVGENDHYWFETSAYFRMPDSETPIFEKSVAAVSINGAEKVLLQYLNDLQEALLKDGELVPNPFY